MDVVDRRAGRLVAVTLVVVCLLAAGCTRTSGRWQQAKASEWDRVLSDVDSNGNVTVATALRGFSLAFGPLPGVPAPPEPAPRITSATIAVHRVMQHWSELTADQQDAVRAAIDSGSTTGTKPPRRLHGGGAARPARAPQIDPDIRCPAADAGTGVAEWRALVTAAEAKLAPVLGAPLYAMPGSDRRSDQFQLVVAVNNRQYNLPGGTRPTKLYASSCRLDSTAPAGQATGCTIHVNPAAFDASIGAQDRHAMMLHELVHCVTVARFGEAVFGLPAWYTEGSATWLMTALAGGDGVSAALYNEDYLDLPEIPLYERSYGAVGFFAHLAETGTDAAARLMPIGRAIIAGNKGSATVTDAGNRAGWDAAGPTEAFLDSWGPGFVRGRYPGKAWNTGGPGLPSDHRPQIPWAPVGNGETADLTAEAAAPSIAQLDVTAEILTVRPDGAARGRFAVGVGRDMSLAEAAGTVFCARPGGCDCPAGSPGAGTKFTQLAGGPNYLGHTGGPAAATVTVVGITVAEFCSQARDTCVVGSWVTTRVEASAPGVMNEVGGAGVRLSIDKAGVFTVDFDQMAPMVFTGIGVPIGGQFVYRGVMTAAITLPPPTASEGNFQLLRGDWSKVTVALKVTTPFTFDLNTSLAEIAGTSGPGAGGVDTQPFAGGAWKCTGDTFIWANPPGSKVLVTWTMRRAG